MGNSIYNIKCGLSDEKISTYCTEILVDVYTYTKNKQVFIPDDVLATFTEYTLKNYYRRFDRNLGYDTLKKECVTIVNFIISILNSSSLFKIKESKFYYEHAVWSVKLNRSVKDIIRKYFESNSFHENIVDYDKTKCSNIIYKIIKEVLDYYKDNTKYFKGVDNVCNIEPKQRIDFRALSSQEKNTLRLEILNYYKSHLKETMQEIADVFNVEVRNVSFVINEYLNEPSVNFSTYEDKKRGPAETPFNVIPAEVFIELIEVLHNKVPADFNLDHASWSGYAVVDYLQKVHNLNVTRHYIYYILKKFKISSKFGNWSTSQEELAAIIASIREKYCTS